MSNDQLGSLTLTDAQREAILELASRGSDGSFDQQAISQLFVMSLVEVRNEDRRLGLTDDGRLVLAGLAQSTRRAEPSCAAAIRPARPGCNDNLSKS